MGVAAVLSLDERREIKRPEKLRQTLPDRFDAGCLSRHMDLVRYRFVD